MREAGARLMGRDRLGRDVFGRGAPEGLKVIRKAAWQAELFDLIAAYGAINARNKPVLHVVSRRPVMTLEAALQRVEAMLGHAVDWTALERFLPATLDPTLARSSRASSFLAMLELAKQGKLELRQQEAFDTLWVRAA
jgi:segregation and condensation protein A